MHKFLDNLFEHHRFMWDAGGNVTLCIYLHKIIASQLCWYYIFIKFFHPFIWLSRGCACYWVSLLLLQCEVCVDYLIISIMNIMCACKMLCQHSFKIYINFVKLKNLKLNAELVCMIFRASKVHRRDLVLDWCRSRNSSVENFNFLSLLNFS